MSSPPIEDSRLGHAKWPSESASGNSLSGCKVSLESLIGDVLSRKETEKRVAAVRESIQQKAELDAEKRRRASVPSQRLLNNDVLAAVVGVEEGEEVQENDVQRLRGAVERTDAFNQGKMFRFFKNDITPATLSQFPRDALHPESWSWILKEDAARERAIFSGSVADSLGEARCELPDGIVSWLLDSITSEPRKMLRGAYCATLSATSSQRIAAEVTPSHITRMFEGVGAEQTSVDISKKLHSDVVTEEYQERDRLFVVSLLHTITGIAQKMNKETRVRTAELTLRLAADEGAMSNTSLSANIQPALASLLGGEREDTSMGDDMFVEIGQHLIKTVTRPQFQAEILKHIPCSTQRIALFRCRLAHGFYYRDDSYLVRPSDKLFDLTNLAISLSHPRFNVNRYRNSKTREYDFWELAALASILNVVIDGGLDASPSDKNMSRADEERFNNQIDNLAEEIKEISSSIRDTGASHMQRMETKEKLRMLHFRVKYGARTRPSKLKSSILSAASDGNSNIMDKFVAREPREEEATKNPFS